VEAGVGKDQLGRGAAREEFDHDFGFFRARMHVFAVGAVLGPAPGEAHFFGRGDFEIDALAPMDLALGRRNNPKLAVRRPKGSGRARRARGRSASCSQYANPLSLESVDRGRAGSLPC
jgi:hypothetical protein